MGGLYAIIGSAIWAQMVIPTLLSQFSIIVLDGYQLSGHFEPQL
jgi:hypothetical protein